MKILLILSTLLLSALVLMGCGGSKEISGQCDPPDWYSTLPSDPNYFFAAATAESKDLQLAVDKASTSARAEIARQVEVRVQALQKKFDEETGISKDAQLLAMFTSASKTVVSTSLSESIIKHQNPCKDGEVYRAYVLMEYAKLGSSEKLHDQIMKNEQMYTRFRATESYKELEEETKKFDEWKKNQEMPANQQ